RKLLPFSEKANSILNMPPHNWSVEEVCNWVRTLQVQENVVDRFKENKIDGAKLMNNYIDDNLLRNKMKISNWNERFNVLQSISFLNKEDEQTIVPLVFPKLETPTFSLLQVGHQVSTVNATENSREIMEADNVGDDDNDDEGTDIISSSEDSNYFAEKTIPEQEITRIIKRRKKYGYLKKWMYMENDELLPVYGESDEEQNYIPSDLERDMMEEELQLNGKKSLFVIKSVDGDQMDIDNFDEKETKVDNTQELIKQYINEVKQNWELTKRPKLEEKVWRNWIKLFPPRKHVNPQERLPQLIEQIKSNFSAKSQLSKSARRQCGILDITLHEIFEIEWKISLIKNGKIPQKPPKKPKKDKQREKTASDNGEKNSDDDSYDSDFIDDSEVTYTAEELAEFARVGIEIQPIIEKELPTIENHYNSETTIASSKTSPKKSSEPFAGKEIIVINSDSDMDISSANDEKEIVAHEEKKCEISNASNGNNSKKESGEIDEISQKDPIAQERQKIHWKVSEYFLNYGIDELKEKWSTALELMKCDEAKLRQEQLEMVQIIDEHNRFRSYMHWMTTKGNTEDTDQNFKEFEDEFPGVHIPECESWKEYYNWRKSLASSERKLRQNKKEIPENDVHEPSAIENFEEEFENVKNYIGDSDCDDEPLAVPGRKKKSKPKIRPRETADVIEQRKARMLLENDYQRRYEKQEEDTRHEKGVIINLGHRDDDEHIYIHEHLATKLKEHQKEGVRFLWKNIIMFDKGCVLAHSMGLGNRKENQSPRISRSVASIDSDKCKSCPVFKLGDSYRYSAQRFDLLEKWKNGGILIMGYEMYRYLVTADAQCEQYSHYLLNPGPSLVVADEGHMLKNKERILPEVLKGLKTPSRIILTGSPLQNNLEEYWCTINFVCPNYLGKLEDFKRVYIEPIEAGLYTHSGLSDVKRSRRMLLVLSKIIEDIVHRCNNSILEKELKPKYEFCIACRMGEQQLEIYKSLVDSVRSEGGSPIRYTHLLSVLCNHPAILLASLQKKKSNKDSKEPAESKENKENKESKETQESNYIDLTNESDDCINESRPVSNSVHTFILNMENFISGMDFSASGKMVLLAQILKECEKIQDKVLIFSKSIPTMNYIEKLLIRWKSSPRFLIRIDGDTLISDRQSRIDKFNNSQEWRVALISMRTGALGVNLIGANRVVLFDGEWNPSFAEQAIGRTYRYGQKKQVYVYRFVTYGTFEEKLFVQNIHKMGLSMRVLDQRNLTKIHSKSEINAHYFSVPLPDAECKLPSILNFNDKLLESVADRHRKHILEIHPMKSYFNDDFNEPDEDDKLQYEDALKNEKERLKH
ncbi:3948_t:CDS:10, partial [Diversispora eburnea]